MYLGRILELTDAEKLYDNPLHPYTKALLSAIPIADPFIEEDRERIVLKGEVPSPLEPPEGCSFHPRCEYAGPLCRKETPQLREVEDGHFVSCMNLDMM
jgi:oligopeptide transport system ATP-binding protein